MMVTVYCPDLVVVVPRHRAVGCLLVGVAAGLILAVDDVKVHFVNGDRLFLPTVTLEVWSKGVGLRWYTKGAHVLVSELWVRVP